MPEPRKIHIGYALDENLVAMLVNSINSIHVNSTQSQPVFHVITEKPSTIERITRSVEQHIRTADRPQIEYTVMSDQHMAQFSDYDRRDREARKDINPIHYCQLLFDQYFQVDRLIYLEADQLALRDITDLYDTEMQDKGIAAVPHHHSFRPPLIAKHLGDTLANYFNAGVTLIDYAHWRAHGVLDHVNQVLMANKQASEPMFEFYTQGVLNIVFVNDFCPISSQYNFIISHNYRDGDFYEDGVYHKGTENIEATKKRMLAECAILHFNGRCLFSDKKRLKPLKKIYRKYDLTGVMPRRWFGLR